MHIKKRHEHVSCNNFEEITKTNRYIPKQHPNIPVLPKHLINPIHLVAGFNMFQPIWNIVLQSIWIINLALKRILNCQLSIVFPCINQPCASWIYPHLPAQPPSEPWKSPGNRANLSIWRARFPKASPAGDRQILEILCNLQQSLTLQLILQTWAWESHSPTWYGDLLWSIAIFGA